MAVGYAQDIRPKFREQDITCMSRRRVRLDDAEWMRDPGGGIGFADYANARRVFAALSAGRMPPDAAWPPEWLETYQHWIDGGFAP